MNIETVFRLLSNAGFRNLGADDVNIYMEDPACIIRSFETFLEYAWTILIFITGIMLAGWAWAMIRGSKNAELRSITNNLKKILDNYSSKIILPIDNIVANEISNFAQTRIAELNDINNDDIALDIGPKTIESFSNYIQKSKIIIWNGPVGYSELKKFEKGTKVMCDVLSKVSATTIIGGGDTASSVINFGYKNSFTHISTGGGATLELLEGKDLPGISIINDI